MIAIVYSRFLVFFFLFFKLLEFASYSARRVFVCAESGGICHDVTKAGAVRQLFYSCGNRGPKM